MGCCCCWRCFLITLCILQLVTTVERQVFEFLGFMWAPIIGNFVHLIFTIVGLAAACRYNRKTLVVYTVWCLIWIGWNAFMICFYLEVGLLTRDNKILNIGMGSKSWWYDNGLGCRVINNSTSLLFNATNDTSTQRIINSTSFTQEVKNTTSLPLTSTTTSQSSIFSILRRDVPTNVEGCFVEYYYVEVLHSGIQCLLALLGFCISCCVIHAFNEEDDDSSQPVHDELEYIKMRYRSPARQSFRGNKTYENIRNCPGDATLDARTSDRYMRSPAAGGRIRADSANKDGESEVVPILTRLPSDDAQTSSLVEGQTTIPRGNGGGGGDYPHNYPQTEDESTQI